MKRQAVLIEASGTQGQKGYLEGAAKDVDNFREYLLRDYGGAWEPAEIVILRNPTRAETLRAIAAAKAADYSFVTASGHGHHQGGSQNETKFCLKGDDEVSASELNSGSARCTVVLDCCRHVTHAVQFEETRAVLMAKSARIARPRQMYRTAFEKAIEAAEYGCSYFYSCGLNQAAQEDSNGGYYSRALVVCAGDWHEKVSFAGAALLDVVDAHTAAATVVTRREPQQKPEHQAGRRMRYFPFAVYP